MSFRNFIIKVLIFIFIKPKKRLEVDTQQLNVPINIISNKCSCINIMIKNLKKLLFKGNRKSLLYIKIEEVVWKYYLIIAIKNFGVKKK